MISQKVKVIKTQLQPPLVVHLFLTSHRSAIGCRKAAASRPVATPARGSAAEASVWPVESFPPKKKITCP